VYKPLKQEVAPFFRGNLATKGRVPSSTVPIKSAQPFAPPSSSSSSSSWCKHRKGPRPQPLNTKPQEADVIPVARRHHFPGPRSSAGSSFSPSSLSSNDLPGPKKTANRTLDLLRTLFGVKLSVEHANHVKNFFHAQLNVPEARNFGYSHQKYINLPFPLFHFFESELSLKSGELCPVATFISEEGSPVHLLIGANGQLYEANEFSGTLTCYGVDFKNYEARKVVRVLEHDLWDIDLGKFPSRWDATAPNERLQDSMKRMDAAILKMYPDGNPLQALLDEIAVEELEEQKELEELEELEETEGAEGFSC